MPRFTLISLLLLAASSFNACGLNYYIDPPEEIREVNLVSPGAKPKKTLEITEIKVPETRARLSPSKEVDLLAEKPAKEIAALIKGEKKPPTPEAYKSQLKTASGNWFYGSGFGRSVLNIGIAVFYPPYAIYLVSNAGLQIAGYDGVYPSDILPGEARETVNSRFNEVVSVPGRFNALVFGEDFRE